MEKIGDILPVLERAYAIGLRDKHIVDLTGISAGTMSRAKNGTDPLRGQDWLDCKNLVLDCEELARRNSLPINWTDLRAVRRQLEFLREERRNPPGELQSADWELLSNVLTTADPGTLLSNLGITRAELLKRLEEASRRFEGAIEAIRRSNVDAHAVTEILNGRS